MVVPVSRKRRVLVSVLAYVAVVLFGAAAIWLLSADARREVDALATANADSTQWSLAQSEVEFLSFASAARAVLAGQAQPAEARRRFDVFYSRVQTLNSARAFAEVRARPEVASSLADINVFLADAIPGLQDRPLAVVELEVVQRRDEPGEGSESSLVVGIRPWQPCQCCAELAQVTWPG